MIHCKFIRSRLLLAGCAALLLLPALSQTPTTVTIGAVGATSPTLPVSTCWNFTYSQQIYTAAQVGVSGTITKLRFFYVSGPNSNSRNWTVFLGQTTLTEFAGNSEWVPFADLTQVWSGNVTFPAEGNWLEVTLDVPFAYSNASNLVVAVDENSGGLNCTVQWGSFESAVNSGIYYRADGTNPNPASPPTASGRTGQMPRLQLDILTCSVELTVTPATPTICPGTTVQLVAGGADTYAWSPGAGLNTISGSTVSAGPATTTTYTVQSSQDGCTGSAEVTVTVLPAPPTPVITRNVDTLFATGSGSFQWSFGGAEIPGATGNFHVATENGTYRVEVTDANGCSSTSDGYFMSFVGLDERAGAAVRVHPNPGNGLFFIDLGGPARPGDHYLLFDATGRAVLRDALVQPMTAVQVPHAAEGLYFLQVVREQAGSTHRIVVGR